MSIVEFFSTLRKAKIKVTLEEGIGALVDALDIRKIKETSSDLIRGKYA